jgi:hypothetical protein
MRPSGTQLVAAKPFADWLNARLAYWRERAGDEGAVTALCQELGWDGQSGTRRALRMRQQLAESAIGRKNKQPGVYGTRTVTHADYFARRTVEEALHRAGVRLGELYPYEALVDEFTMEYLVPRDQAMRLADAWIERTWQTVWEEAGLFVNEEDRPSCYCRACKRTTRLFMGTCDSCGVAHAPSMIAAAALSPVVSSQGAMPSDALAQARMLRERYRMPYRQISVVMAVYHGVARDERSWRRTLCRLGAAYEPRGVPFKAKEVAA